MKKLLIVLLTFLMIFSSVSCGDKAEKPDSKDVIVEEDASTEAKEETKTEEEKKEEGTEEVETEKEEVGGDTKSIELAFIGSSNTDESIKFFADSCVEKAEELDNVNVTIFDANLDVQKQSNLVDDCVTGGYDGIMIIAVDPKAIVPAVQRAYEADVPVFMLACDVDETGTQYRIASVTADHYESGKLCGESIVKQFPDGAKGVMIEGHPGEDTQIRRTTGFEDAIKDSNIELLDKKGCDGWDPAKALSVTEDFITLYGDEIDYIFSQWDNGSTAIVQALENAGLLEDIYIVSIDGCRAGFDLINEGKIAETAYQDIPQQSHTCVEMLVDYIKTGERGEEVVNIPWEIINIENANFDPGW